MTARASLADVEQFLDRYAVICGNIERRMSHIDDLIPILIVDCNGLVDARLWSAIFGADMGHWRTDAYPELGVTVMSSFAAWRGWHVMVRGREPLTVPAEITAELVLAVAA